MKTKFDFRRVIDGGGAEYTAQHEIWNSVTITLPVGYFDNYRDKYDTRDWDGGEWPPAIEVESFIVSPVPLKHREG